MLPFRTKRKGFLFSSRPSHAPHERGGMENKNTCERNEQGSILVLQGASTGIAEGNPGIHLTVVHSPGINPPPPFPIGTHLPGEEYMLGGL
jgi:hypothetical protein